MTRRFEDISGKRFGRLLVLERTLEKSTTGQFLWLCQCDCGNKCKAISGNLRHNNTTSCGCLRKEETIERFTTHGMRKTPEYTAWARMLSRCINTKNPDYPWYGARGIIVCEEWKADFSTFIRDMGPRPSSGHSIDRIDPNSHYFKENCRWATQLEQQNNRRSNRHVFYNGERMTLRQAIIASGTTISYRTIKSRVFEKGWNIEDALLTELHSSPPSAVASQPLTEKH